MLITPETLPDEGVVLNVDKPLGWSSTDVVRKIKVMLRRAGFPKSVKIGHAGTLDPLADGVLLVCIGKATKRVEALQSEQKEYVAGIELGATTPSYDLEHPVDERYPWEHITGDSIREALTAMEGEQQQMPPLYSAKRMDGKRAYTYARQGKEVELKAVPVTIYAAELLGYEAPHATVRIECSKGTYVRSVARDLGQALGSGGHLTSLRRTRSGGFRYEDSVSLEQVAEMIPTVTESL